MARKKLRNRAGFTLAETLLAVTILLLVSTIVVTGMPAAKKAYEKVVLASNAEVLLSTAASALRDELGTAWNVSQPSTNVLTYFSADTGTRTEMKIDADKIMITEYTVSDVKDIFFDPTETEDETVKEAHELVYTDTKNNSNELYVICSGLTLSSSSNEVMVSGLSVTKQGSGDLVTPMTFSIPVFSKRL